MTQDKMPPGIRTTPPLKDGSYHFEVRVNRSGITMSKRLATIASAKAWKARMDALILSGIDPRTLDDNDTPARVVTASPRVVPQVSTATDEVLDKPPIVQSHMTVRQAIDGYLADRNASEAKLQANQITDYDRVRDDIGELEIANLRNRDLTNYISALLKEPRKRDVPGASAMHKVVAAPKVNQSAKARANARYKAKIKANRPPRKPKLLAGATVRKYITALKNSIKWQAKNCDLEFHPLLFDFDRGRMPAAWGGQRDRRLVAGEEDRLYAAGQDRGGYTYTKNDWRMMIGFALETAMRQQEIAFAKWTDLREGGTKLFIPKENAKTKKDRTVRLFDRAREIIQAQQITCPKGATRIFHQFPNAQAICDGYARLTKRATIENLTFHDLRHEATSRLCERGTMPTMAIMEMTGHDTVLTFKGYLNLITHEDVKHLR
jgi:integrase